MACLIGEAKVRASGNLMDGSGDLTHRIEQAALWAWPPQETAMVEGWLLCAAEGHTRRANSARTWRFTGGDVDPALGRLEAWYAARGLPACLMLTDAARPDDLDARLAARGYDRLTPVTVLLGEAAAAPAEAGSARVEFLTRPTPSVMNAIADPHWDAATRRRRAALFARIRRPHVFGLSVEDGEPAAAGLCVVEGDLAGIFSLRTAVPARRRGHGRRLLQALSGWAYGAGARRLYAQVEDENGPARSLWSPSGARPLYRYWYREQRAG